LPRRRGSTRIVPRGGPLLNDGSGGFEPATAHDGGLNASTGEIGDIDGDGRKDIAAAGAATPYGAGQSTLTVLLRS
jgi:hypothetical protein